MNPIAVVGSMQQELTRTYNLPLPVIICIKSLSAVHWVWWLHRKKKMIQPENIIPAALGTVLQGGLNFAPNVIKESIQGIAKLILIATRIDESVQRMQALAATFADFKNALSRKFAPIIVPQWIKNPEAIVFSVHFSNKWLAFGREFISYMRRIYYCLLKIFSGIFKLGMQLWDTYHAFVFPHDAVPELLVNGMYWFRKIQQNHDYLNNKLEQYQPLIQNILEATRSSVSSDRLIDRAKTVINLTVAGFEAIDGVNHVIGERIVGNVKKAVHFMKSKLLCKEWEEVRTPFVLKKLPDYKS